MSRLVLLYDRVKVSTISGNYAGIVLGFDGCSLLVAFDDDTDGPHVPLRDFPCHKQAWVPIKRAEREDQ